LRLLSLNSEEEKMKTRKIEEILSGEIINITEKENCIHILVKVSEGESLVIHYNGYNPLFNKKIIGKDIIYAKDNKLYVGDHNKYVEIN